MFSAINATTKENISSLVIGNDPAYSFPKKDVWYADPNEIELCPESIDIKCIPVLFREGHESVNFKGTNYIVAPHFFIPNKSKLGINTIPETREHKLAKNWIYSKIKNNDLKIAYSSVTKPFKYNNLINLFDLPIDKNLIGIETSARIASNKKYRRADVICPFITKHPLLGNGIVFEIQFSKQTAKAKIDREMDWAIRGYSICWIFEKDIETLSDIMFKTKKDDLEVDSFASLIKMNGKTFVRGLKVEVQEEIRKLLWKRDEIINEIRAASLSKFEFDKEDIRDIVEDMFEDLKNKIQPICPKCNMAARLQKNNSNGSKFWGCSNYPRCNWTSAYAG